LAQVEPPSVCAPPLPAKGQAYIGQQLSIGRAWTFRRLRGHTGDERDLCGYREASAQLAA
jgi:hypothetical protein